MTRLWDKGKPLEHAVLRYTAGEDHQLDERLVAYDIRGTRAHARMLCKQKLINETDCDAICAALDALAESHAQGEWHIELEDEDAHTAIENRLIAAIGSAGGRVHLGRSRNDQVLTALRLYLLAACDDIQTALNVLQNSLNALAERQGSIPLPGYTHMQHAMPSTVGLWCGGFAEALADAEAGLQGARRRLSKNPLGSAAGYGTPGLDLDREFTTAELGFAENSGARYRGAAVARKGRSWATVRNRSAATRSWTAGERPAVVLHTGVRLRQFGGGDDDGVVNHAAETQSRRTGIGARGKRHRSRLPGRVLDDYRKTAVRIPARRAAHQGAAVSVDRSRRRQP